MFVGYAHDHTGDVYRFIHLKTQHVILSRDARWMNIMWRAYMRKQQCINHGLQIIDEDCESDDDDEIQENWANQQPEDRDKEEVPPLDQQRRLGLDIDMIGAREGNLGSTRSQTLEMRAPNNQEIERANINMDNWTQETCFMSVITSGPDEPNNFNEAWNHHAQMKEENGEEQLQKNYIVWKTEKSGEPYIKQMCLKTEG